MKPILGFIEALVLPKLDIVCHAKVDTGACSSSLHADNIETYEQNGSLYVRFHVFFNQNGMLINRYCEGQVISTRTVASSNGQKSDRYVIRTPISLHGKTWEIDLNLSHRGSMKYPMLLGREAIAGRFLVDVERTFVAQVTP